MAYYEDEADELLDEEEYMIVLTQEELLALGEACEILADSLRDMSEAVPQVVDQVAQMARDVK